MGIFFDYLDSSCAKTLVIKLVQAVQATGDFHWFQCQIKVREPGSVNRRVIRCVLMYTIGRAARVNQLIFAIFIAEKAVVCRH